MLICNQFISSYVFDVLSSKCSTIILDAPSELQTQTLHAYYQSVAPGTAANRLRQAKSYLTFCVMYGVNYLNPTRLHVAMYVKFLANTHKAPNTVKNYLSGARHWVNFHKGSDFSFSTPEARAVLKSVIDSSKHVPLQAYPLSPADIRVICNYIDSHPEVAMAMKPALLIGYICFFRSSNILSPSLSSWGGPHTLHVSNVCLFECHLPLTSQSGQQRLVTPVGLLF